MLSGPWSCVTLARFITASETTSIAHADDTTGQCAAVYGTPHRDWVRHNDVALSKTHPVQRRRWQDSRVEHGDWRLLARVPWQQSVRPHHADPRTCYVHLSVYNGSCCAVH